MIVALLFWGGFLAGAAATYWLLDHTCEIEVRIFRDPRPSLNK